MKLEIRSGVTNERLRDLLRRNGLPTSGNKDRVTYRIASLAVANEVLCDFNRRDRSLIHHCLGCVRTWRKETREAARVRLDPNWNAIRFWDLEWEAGELDKICSLTFSDFCELIR